MTTITRKLFRTILYNIYVCNGRLRKVNSMFLVIHHIGTAEYREPDVCLETFPPSQQTNQYLTSLHVIVKWNNELNSK